MKKTLIFSISLLVIFNLKAQNQFNIGQYAVHQPLVNPSTISTYEDITFGLLYKEQWTGLTGAPSIQGFTFSMPIDERNKHFAGINVLNDNIGINNSTEISGTYAYKVRTSINSRLIFGATASLNLVKSKLEDINTTDPNDPLYSVNSPVYPLPNFKFSTYFFVKKFYLGFVMPNILENKVIEQNGSTAGYFGFDPQNLHYYLHGGYKFDLKHGNTFVPSFLIKDVAGSPIQFDLNMNFMFRHKFGVGLNLRSSKDAMIMLSMYVLPELLLSYGYEYGLSELNKFNTGTHEIVLIYRVRGKKDVIAFPRL
ncbi:MAG TPA: type IX secretion system membrane protein PorP/SprF [Crocinitomix sp.]|nr:type IX secretion system membrane protein PorP/SprF [Crocinitomix sp.]